MGYLDRVASNLSKTWDQAEKTIENKLAKTEQRRADRAEAGLEPDYKDDLSANMKGLYEHVTLTSKRDPGEKFALGKWTHRLMPFGAAKKGTREVMKAHEEAGDCLDVTYGGTLVVNVGASAADAIVSGSAALVGTGLYLGLAGPVSTVSSLSKSFSGEKVEVAESFREVPCFEDAAGFYGFVEGAAVVVTAPMTFGAGVAYEAATTDLSAGDILKNNAKGYLEMAGNRLLGYDPNNKVVGDQIGTVLGGALAFVAGAKGAKAGPRILRSGSKPRVAPALPRIESFTGPQSEAVFLRAAKRKTVSASPRPKVKKGPPPLPESIRAGTAKGPPPLPETVRAGGKQPPRPNIAKTYRPQLPKKISDARTLGQFMDTLVDRHGVEIFQRAFSKNGTLNIFKLGEFLDEAAWKVLSESDFFTSKSFPYQGLGPKRAFVEWTAQYLHQKAISKKPGEVRNLSRQIIDRSLRRYEQKIAQGQLSDQGFAYLNKLAREKLPQADYLVRKYLGTYLKNASNRRTPAPQVKEPTFDRPTSPEIPKAKPLPADLAIASEAKKLPPTDHRANANRFILEIENGTPEAIVDAILNPLKVDLKLGEAGQINFAKSLYPQTGLPEFRLDPAWVRDCGRAIRIRSLVGPEHLRNLATKVGEHLKKKAPRGSLRQELLESLKIDGE